MKGRGKREVGSKKKRKCIGKGGRGEGGGKKEEQGGRRKKQDCTE